MNKFCTNCGEPVVEGNKFCGNCGSKYEAEEVISEKVSEVVAEDVTADDEKTSESSSEEVVIKPIIEHYEKTDPEVLAAPIASEEEVVPPVAPATPAAPVAQVVPAVVPPVSDTPEISTADIDKKNIIIFGVVALALFFSGFALSPLEEAIDITEVQRIIETLLFLFPVAGIVVMIVGRVKYPKSIFLKVVMWIIIVATILTVIAIILLVLLCTAMCAMCSGMGILIA